MSEFLKERKTQILEKGKEMHELACAKKSLAGSVSQRACVFCGSRVVLYPIVDTLHLIHGPVGCAAYTWDIRGSLTSGPSLYRLSFTTDLNEDDVIFGGEKKLYSSVKYLIDKHQPKAAFIYSTCIVGLIGDDVEAVCKKLSRESGIDVIPVHAPGFAGTKKDGYKAACEALEVLVRSGQPAPKIPESINILGDFNLAGELWLLRDYYKKMGVNIVSTITGDGRVDDIRKAGSASLNLVQCSGSMIHLAKFMEKEYGIPFKRVSYFGIEDMSDALYEVSGFFNNEQMHQKATELVKDEVQVLLKDLAYYKQELLGKKAAIYVGGAFKAISLIKALRLIGMKTVLVGSQTGSKEDYDIMRELCDEGTVIVDDSNPIELAEFVKEKGAHLFIGGVKERPIAYKLGLGFCDHNHERKEALAGYEGMLNFAREVYATVNSPIWKFVER